MMKAKLRKEELLNVAITIARKVGYKNVYRAQIAKELGCAESLVHHYFGTMPQLRRAIISASIARKDLDILAQGLAAKEPKALAAPLELKQAAALSMIGG